MTTAKRRNSNSATFVADSNHHYTSLSQQQQQQQEPHQQQQQQQQQSQQQYFNQSFYNQQQSNHESQRLLQQEPTSSSYSNSNSNSNTAIQRHHQPYPNYNATSYSNTSAPASATTPTTTSSSIMRGECSVKLPLDILWLPKSAMRPVGPDASHSDCILVVGVSRPKLAIVFLTVMLISLFLTFHVLYDSAVYNIQAAQAVHEHHHHRLALMNSNSIGKAGTPAVGSSSGSMKNLKINRANHLSNDYDGGGDGGMGGGNVNYQNAADVSSSNQQISHPMVFPSNRVHFPKTSRRLPQALIIGIRKCGTRALLEMLYLHPRIQKAGGEVHFFDRDENYMKGLEWYRKKMPHSFRGQITIEKSPSYFVSPEVPERVRAMNASIKLLLIVREPVTRAISDYTQLRSHAATATVPLANEQQRQQPATSSSSSNAGKVFSHTMLLNKLNASTYSSQAYANSLGGERGHRSVNSHGHSNGNGNVYGSGAGGIKINFKYPYNSRRQYETTTASPQTSAGSAAAQILSKSFEELAIFPNGTVNESYRPLSISMYHLHLHRWLEVFPREQILIVNGDRLIDDPVSQLKTIEDFLGIEHRITSNHFYFNETKGFYCLRYDSGDRCLRETKGRKHPHVDPLAISKLRKFFAEHNQRFYELVGEDLGWPEE